MADPLTLIVSIAGLAGFGIQMVQVLNQYASSVKDSKGHIGSIIYDIKLTTSVLEEFDAHLKEESLAKSDPKADCAVMLSGGAGEAAAHAIKRCRTVFDEICELLKVKKTQLEDGKFKLELKVSLSQKLKWNFLQPRIELLRSDLDKIKATLQLQLTVVTYGLMKRMYASDPATHR